MRLRGEIYDDALKLFSNIYNNDERRTYAVYPENREPNDDKRVI